MIEICTTLKQVFVGEILMKYCCCCSEKDGTVISSAITTTSFDFYASAQHNVGGQRHNGFVLFVCASVRLCISVCVPKHC